MGRLNGAEAAELGRFGAEIARRMELAEKTTADLAVAAGVDDSQMSKVLAGTAGLSLRSLRRVAVALGCTRADILSAVDAVHSATRPRASLKIKPPRGVRNARPVAISGASTRRATKR